LRHIRLIDNTGSSIQKRFLLCDKNVSGEATSSDIVWRDVKTKNGDCVYVNYALPFSIQATLLSAPNYSYPQITAFNGERYYVSGNDLVYETTTGSGSYFDVHNNTSSSMLVNLCRDGYVCASVTIVASDTYSFAMKPTLFVGIYDDLNASVDIATLNTEISLLGIQSADVVATGTVGNYSFNLANIVMS